MALTLQKAHAQNCETEGQTLQYQIEHSGGIRPDPELHSQHSLVNFAWKGAQVMNRTIQGATPTQAVAGTWARKRGVPFAPFSHYALFLKGHQMATLQLQMSA